MRANLSLRLLLLLLLLVVATSTLVEASAKLRLDVGLNHFYKKRYLEAFREFKAAAEEDPRNADAHYNLGRVYKIQGFLKEAVAEFQVALALNPNLTAARRELAEIQGFIKSDVTTQLKLQGQEEALKQRITDVGSNSALKRGQDLLNRGDIARAIPEFEQAVQADPYNAKILKVLGYLYFRSNRYANALSSYERAQRLAPNDAEIAYDLGLIHLRSDNARSAADSFSRAIALDSGLVKAHYGLGEAYESLGQFEDAAFQYRKCLELNPGLRQAEDRVRELSGKLGYMYFTRGSFYYQQGDFEKAEALLSLSAKYGSLTDAQKRQVDDMLGAARYWV
ncbi:MAG TPA: tetratricopeptide repeat protein, partial [Candidatus Ozemobacteraceae bacterium]|nr:tetratricopeptide repeat protein [Candidatus Ozemobacteraceae bacterium]